jgi:hypothetical protein
MLNHLKIALEKPGMVIYLRILAIFYGYGAMIHLLNLLGFGSLPWEEMSLSWKLGDIFYGVIDPLTGIGLWLKKVWGIVFFLIAALSQLILYSGFSNQFAFTIQQQQTLWSLIIFHLISLGILGLFFGVSVREQRQQNH